MLFDLWVPAVNPFATPDLLAALGAEAERRGVHGLWVGEHVVLFDDYASRYPYSPDGQLPAPPGTGILDPFITLSYLAAATSTLRLGTAMCLLPQRNPVYTGKEVATLDWLSGGRLDFGVGVGWLREEFEALGVAWERRGERTDDYLAVLRTLWCDETSEHTGPFYHLPPCRMDPKPVQDPHPPLHIGGESDAALRRVARAGNGWVTFNRTPEELAAPLRRLDEVLAEAGRTRESVQVTVCPYFNPLTPDGVEQYAAAGVDRLAALFFATTPDEVAKTFDDLEPCLERARAC